MQIVLTARLTPDPDAKRMEFVEFWRDGRRDDTLIALPVEGAKDGWQTFRIVDTGLASIGG